MTCPTPSINNKSSNINLEDNTKKTKKPYLGRAINWFHNTSSGRGTGAALRAVGAVVFALAGLVVAVNAIALATVGVALLTTLIGIPLGLIFISIAGAGLGLSGGLFKAAWCMGKKADNDVTIAKQLASEEALS